MSSISASVDADAAIARMKGAPERIRAALVKTVTRLGLQMQGRVKTKLTGEVLSVRTGTLRRSINAKVEDELGGVFGSVGTNVAYAHIHEFGFDGLVPVQAHLRRSKEQFSLSKTKRVAKTGGDILVSAHQRHIKMPERSFLRSTLQDFREQIVTDIKKSVVEAAKP